MLKEENVEIKENMETKEITINIPDGYEIDKENSTFDYIKLKPIAKNGEMTQMPLLKVIILTQILK